MSPWFSQGWTAVELARSRTVKVLFKGERGPLLKDLDEDILCKPRTERHAARRRIIHRLRTQTVTRVDDLLCILRCRYTSWSKDIAIIAS
ncbi:hypothetical protein A1O7_02314, partial [Cladophialophora yegresii CBS 114405]